MKRYYKESFGSKVFNTFNTLLIGVLTFTFLYPVYNTFIVAISDPYKIGRLRVSFVPKGFSLEAFKVMLMNEKILRYYINTISYAIGGTIVLLLVTSMMAYALLFKGFSMRKPVLILLVITMFFSGGLIPSYLLMMRLNLIDTYWVMILPEAVAAFNVIIFRTFFSSIPGSLRESAYIDGASNFTVLFRIILPLSKPLLATFALFTIVRHWNDFFTALVYLNSTEKYPIQMLLRKILINLDYNDISSIGFEASRRMISTRVVKAASIIITITPVLCVYPFLQKYFAKGLLIGSIKE